MPRRVTPEKHAVLMRYLEQGLSISTSAALADVSENYGWLVYPKNSPFDCPCGRWSNHKGGCQFRRNNTVARLLAEQAAGREPEINPDSVPPVFARWLKFYHARNAARDAFAEEVAVLRKEREERFRRINEERLRTLLEREEQRRISAELRAAKREELAAKRAEKQWEKEFFAPILAKRKAEREERKKAALARKVLWEASAPERAKKRAERLRREAASAQRLGAEKRIRSALAGPSSPVSERQHFRLYEEICRAVQGRVIPANRDDVVQAMAEAAFDGRLSAEDLFLAVPIFVSDQRDVRSGFISMFDDEERDGKANAVRDL